MERFNVMGENLISLLQLDGVSLDEKFDRTDWSVLVEVDCVDDFVDYCENNGIKAVLT